MTRCRTTTRGERGDHRRALQRATDQDVGSGVELAGFPPSPPAADEATERAEVLASHLAQLRPGEVQWLDGYGPRYLNGK
jgi:hypothetical protein